MLVLSTACTRGENLGLRVPGGATPRAGRAVVGPADPAAAEVLREWERAGRAALGAALPVPSAFREEVLLDGDAVGALAWSLELSQQQRVQLLLEPRAGASAARLDVFEELADNLYRHMYSAGADGEGAVFDAPRTGRYVVRAQPELGGSGTYGLLVNGGSALIFPVQGGDQRAIRSPFGDNRDGGRRSHGGVDIFAPRGTPVLSVTDGIVETVETTALGGKVVWAKDAVRNLTYFYAHLDEQLVKPGMQLRAGDVLGRVGNTGNATGASPHLHFGVYRPGTIAIDPVPLLANRRLTDPVPDSATTLLGRWAHTRGSGVRLRRSPSEAGEILAELASFTRVRVVGAAPTGWMRVRLEDGRNGYIAGRLLETEAAGTR